ncbi:hypothetical protein GIB67_040908 [Kingdonia uniflora]|uniref:NADH dehydrogenase [ubiquinone] 1 alpha subcomplex subunit 12 n=1 Tax=Kingdonia uniflora TaxID=39325 RepID=A0A7J7L805_9MAGN|nr:hypothetical protein GIB67_040908 [Kingdonia uniflora]
MVELSPSNFRVLNRVPFTRAKPECIFKRVGDTSYVYCLSGQTKIHNIGSTCVGVDKFGNKYYENLDYQSGRHRWVEYGDKNRYNASQVPPEWHGWLHFITDHTGDEPGRYEWDAKILERELFFNETQSSAHSLPSNRISSRVIDLRFRHIALKAIHVSNFLDAIALLMLRPKRYGIEHKQNFSGEGDEYIYHSKGHSLNPGQRDWTRYQPWQPTKTS